MREVGEKVRVLSLLAPPVRMPSMHVKCDGVVTAVKDLETDVTFMEVVVPIKVKE